MKPLNINKCSLLLFIVLLFCAIETKIVNFVYQALPPLNEISSNKNTFNYLFSLGKTMKKHYIDNYELLNSKYNSSEIETISYNKIENIQTIHAVLLGMFGNINNNILPQEQLNASIPSVYYQGIEEDYLNNAGYSIGQGFNDIFAIKGYTSYNKSIFAVKEECKGSTNNIDDLSFFSSNMVRYILKKCDMIIEGINNIPRYIMNSQTSKDINALVEFISQSINSKSISNLSLSSYKSLVIELSNTDDSNYISIYYGRDTIVNNLDYREFKNTLTPLLTSEDDISLLCSFNYFSHVSTSSLTQPSSIGYIIIICLLLICISILGIMLHHQISSYCLLKREYINFNTNSNIEQWEEEQIIPNENELISNILDRSTNGNNL